MEWDEAPSLTHLMPVALRYTRGVAQPLLGGFMAQVLEALMLLSFGLSWPINALNAWKARTARGTSPAFLALITFGYVAGIASKFVGHNITWVLGVYLFNLVALVANDLIYLRNLRLDARG